MYQNMLKHAKNGLIVLILIKVTNFEKTKKTCKLKTGAKLKINRSHFEFN